MNPTAENTAQPLLQAVDLHKRYGRRAVLSQINLEIHSGEVVTVIGPNGSGKTTLLRTLLGLEEPSSGNVFRRFDLRIGYVPQKIHFSPVMPFSVRYFLGLFCDNRQKIAALANELEILNLLHRQVYALSGGELQRVMLAQALLTDPHLLVLDEPVQGVDFTGQARIYQLVKRVSRARGCAVLMVSHDLHLVMAGTDKVICLNRHICCSGTPQSVSRDPEFVSLFGAEIAGQIALYVHHHDHQHGLSGEVTCEGDHTHGHEEHEEARAEVRQPLESSEEERGEGEGVHG